MAIISKLIAGVALTLMLAASPTMVGMTGGDALAQTKKAQSTKKKNCGCLSTCGGGNNQPRCMSCRARCN